LKPILISNESQCKGQPPASEDKTAPRQQGRIL